MRELKNKLKFKLTADAEIPLQTKKSQQVVVRLARQRNKRTGEERLKVQSVKPIAFEFECEALADFAFQLDKNKSNKQVKEESLLNSLDHSQVNSDVNLVMPGQFTYGKMMYSQIKDAANIKKEFKVH